MSLHVVIGFADRKQKSSPHTVYVGPSGTDARAAMAASTAESFLILNNPFGLRKHNPNAAANRRPVEAAPAPVVEAPVAEAPVADSAEPSPAADEAEAAPSARRRRV